MVDKSKALVSRAALERVLARAAQLQGTSEAEAESPETLTEEQVEELGKEVGLSPQHLRQALAEERAHIEPTIVEGTGLAFQLFGPDFAETQRMVRGKPERILAAIDRWMQKEEGLKVKRQRPDIITWEPMRGVFGSIRRMLGAGDFALTRADQVSATVVAVDEEFTLVRLHAGFGGLRNAMRNRTIGGTAFGAVVSAGLFGLGFVIGLPGEVQLLAYSVAPVPVLLSGGGSYYSARKTQQDSIMRGHLALEQVLDRLERGDAERPSLLKMIESALPPAR
jgi:hypothetical protein